MLLTTSHGPQSHYERTPGAGSTGPAQDLSPLHGVPSLNPGGEGEPRHRHRTPSEGIERGGPHQEALGMSSLGADTAIGTTSTSGLSLSLRFTLLLSFPARHEVILALTAPPSAGFAKALRAKRTTSRTLGFTFCIFKGRRQGKEAIRSGYH